MRITTLFASRACAVLAAAGVEADALFVEEGGGTVPPLVQLAKVGQAAVNKTIVRLRRRRILVTLVMDLGFDDIVAKNPESRCIDTPW
jgi:hypothetical protein